MPRKLDPDEVLRLYHRTHNAHETARLLGVDPSSVSRLLNKHGIAPGKGANSPTKIDRQTVLNAYNEMHNQHRVAKALGISLTAVGRILRDEFGIHLGKGANVVVKHHIPMDEIAQRYLAGESTVQLGAEYGVDPERIRRRLKTRGIKRRSLVQSRARGAKNGQWKNGKSEQRRNDKNMHYYRRQAYEVAAICLGKPLPQGWVIHHIDEDYHNNHPSNLMIFESLNRHTSYHQQLLRLQRAGQTVDAIQLALENGAQKLPLPAHPIEF